MKKITKIEQQKKRHTRYSIFLNEEFAFGIDKEILLKCSLQEGMELDEKDLKKVIQAEEQNKANNYALKFLSYRARSEKEIVDRMNQKYEENIIKETIQFLKMHNYIDDYQFGVQLAKDKQNFKKAGKNLLKQELYKKGLKRDTIEEIIDKMVDNEEEYIRALELATKKANIKYKNDDKNVKYRKLSSFLARKGYSFDIISIVLKKVL